MSEVWLLRHATPLVALGTCYGAMDMPADDEHTAASADAFWQAWDAEHREAPAYLLCSPLRRCVQLAEALQRQRPQVALRLEANLREMNFGHWEGVLWADIPKVAVDDWASAFATHAFGGVESVQDLIARVGQVWDAQLSSVGAEYQSPAPAPSVWVTHAGVIKAARWWVESGGLKIAAADQWPTVDCAFGEWQKLSVSA